MNTSQRSRGFTLIELLVVMAIIALLVSILIPSLGMAQQLARKLPCQTNLKGIGSGLAMYTQDNAELMVPLKALIKQGSGNYTHLSWWWADLIIPYFDTEAKRSQTLGDWGIGTGADTVGAVSYQPSDGNYTKNYSAHGIIYSRRMDCPVQKNADRGEYMMNISGGLWGCDFTGLGFIQQANPGTSWFTPTVNKPVRVSQFKRLADYCAVLEPNTLGSYGACNFTFMTNVNYVLDVAKKAPHLKSVNGVALDGHVVTYDTKFLAGYSGTGYPFGVP